MKKYILGLLALAFMPMATWAQDEPEPEPVLIDIETAFPDANFRAYIKDFDDDKDGKLSEAEIAAIQLLDVKNMGIEKLDGIENLTAVTTIYCYGNNLTSLDVTALPKLQDLRCGDSGNETNKITTLDLSQNPELDLLYCTGVGLTELNLENNPLLKHLHCDRNALTSLDVSANENLTYFICSENNIGTLNVSNNKKLINFECHTCGLSELNVENNKNLKRLYCYNNDIEELVLTVNTDIDDLRFSNNPIKEIDLSKLNNLKTLYCSNCELTTLDLTNNLLLTNIQADSNHLTTLDLSKNDKVTTASIKGQTKEVDAIVIDREKIAIEVIPTNDETVLNDELFYDLSGNGTDASALEYVEKDGKCYLVIASSATEADVDFYGATVKYKFNSQCASEKEKDEPLWVTITTYPYIMYVNPYSKDLNDGFYSGTLIVDYDAVVPVGAEAYIATKVLLDSETMIKDGDKVTFDQLQMTKVGEAGDVIPANTPIYVKSATETGLFAFARNLEEKELVSIPDGNIFEGTLEDKNVTPGEVLTLGREDKQETGAVGFWAFLGSYVPAHRVFIDSAILSETDGANGFTLNFDGAADGIKTISTTTADGAYYTLQGIKVSEPTQKGVYIHNGKKIMVK